MARKELIVAIDAGFDGCKTCVVGIKDNKDDQIVPGGGILNNVPFNIQDITEELSRYGMGKKKNDSFIQCIIGEGKEKKTYMIGQNARTYLMAEERRVKEKATMEAFYSLERFNMDIFGVALNAFLCNSLAHYAKYSATTSSVETLVLDELKDWDLKVGVALPHKYVDKLSSSVKKILIGEHKLDLIIGEDLPVTFNYKIDEVFYNSQIICALQNEVVDDFGMDVEGTTVYDKLPALVIDGGYKTVGEFKFTEDESIVGDDSNMEYAMLNINQAVADKISMYTPGYYNYMIEDLCRKKEIIQYYDNSGVKQDLDVCAIKEKAIKDVSKKYIEHLKSVYNRLLTIKMIIVAGGTGELYYDCINEYCKTEKLNVEVALAGKNGFFAGKCEPVYAVVCGLYKGILIELNKDKA